MLLIKMIIMVDAIWNKSLYLSPKKELQTTTHNSIKFEKKKKRKSAVSVERNCVSFGKLVLKRFFNFVGVFF